MNGDGAALPSGFPDALAGDPGALTAEDIADPRGWLIVPGSYEAMEDIVRRMVKIRDERVARLQRAILQERRKPPPPI